MLLCSRQPVACPQRRHRAVVRAPGESEFLQVGADATHDVELFGIEVERLIDEASDIAAWPRQRPGIAQLDRRDTVHHDRDRFRGLERGGCRGVAGRKDELHPRRHQFFGLGREIAWVVQRRAPLDDEVAPVFPAQTRQLVDDVFPQQRCLRVGRGTVAQEADARDTWRLG